MNKPTLGVGVTGSFCTFKKTLGVLKDLAGTYNIIPILSAAVRDFDTRFYEHTAFRKDIEEICANPCIDSIQEAEPIGPKGFLDILMILPCTGNTLAKLAVGLTDTPVTMAAKAHIRNEKPLLVCVSTNDGLGASFKNIAALYNKKNIYIAPLGQDDAVKKPNSLVVKFESIPEALAAALAGYQLQPILR